MADEVEESEQEGLTQEEDRQTRLTQFPQTRVRNMMKQDPDLQLANKEAVYIITKATELFVGQFAKEAYKSTVQGKRKTIQKRDLDLAITENDEMAFLEGVLE